METKRAVIYLRTTTPSEVAMQAQHDACLEFCQRYKLSVVGTLAEAGQGLILADRPQLDELREMMRQSHVDAVVVHTLDRLARSQEALITLAREAEAHGIEIHSAVGGTSVVMMPLRVEALLLERERLAMLIRNAEGREQERWHHIV